jgi:hypothetical protein
MSAQAWKSAWTDPEHVRMASYRSPWDGTRLAMRGAIPPAIDPWADGTEPGARSQQEGRRGYARYDEYEAYRCSCGHIVYLSDQVGGRCQFCACDNHRPAGTS